MPPFSANPNRFDPYKNFKFRVKWDGHYVAGVSKMSALKRTTQVVTHRDGGDPSSSRKSPGRTEYEAITLERGSTLRDGDLLAADNGEILLVRAAAESVSDATSADALLLARAAYHLGNRHVPLQIELAALRYQHDHVLDGMLRELGLQVTQRTAAFQPEGGAYASHGGHAHGHEGGGGHSHGGEGHEH